MTGILRLPLRSLSKRVLLSLPVLISVCGPLPADPPTGPVTVTIEPDPEIRPGGTDGQGAIADVRVTLESQGPTAARLRLYASNHRATPVEERWLLDEVVELAGSLTVTVPTALLEAGDFSLRAIVFPVERDSGAWNGRGASRADLVHFRYGDDGRVTSFDTLGYTHQRGLERSSESEKTGIQDRHPSDREIHPGPGQHPTQSIDGLKLNAPKINVGEGVTRAWPARDRGPRVVSLSRSPMIVRAAAPGAAQLASNSRSLTVAGTITTKAYDETVPLRYMTVDVYDHDTLSPDDLLGTTVTDVRGSYTIVVDNEDGVGGGGVDVYLYVYSQNREIALLYVVPDGMGDWTPVYYSWKSSVLDDITRDVQIIDFEIKTNNIAATIWSGASAAARLSTRTLRKVEVRYPRLADGTNFRNNIINIDSRHADSPEAVAHEYAHAVMYQAYGSMPEEAGGGHEICASGPKGLAWSEGFANWYGAAAWDYSGDFRWHIGGVKASFERWHCGPTDATVDEGRAAAWLWDLMDAPKDDNGGDARFGRSGYSDDNEGAGIVSTQELINVLWERKHNTVTDYWTHLKTKLSAAESAPSVRISHYNYLTTP